MRSTMSFTIYAFAVPSKYILLLFFTNKRADTKLFKTKTITEKLEGSYILYLLQKRENKETEIRIIR